MEDVIPKTVPESSGSSGEKRDNLTPKMDEIPNTEPPKTDNPSPDVDGEDGTPNREQQESTRSKLALLFVLGFFAILFLCFVFAIMVKASLDDLKDILVGVIGALAGIFGFIVGYYYKTSKD